METFETLQTALQGVLLFSDGIYDKNIHHKFTSTLNMKNFNHLFQLIQSFSSTCGRKVTLERLYLTIGQI